MVVMETCRPSETTPRMLLRMSMKRLNNQQRGCRTPSRGDQEHLRSSATRGEDVQSHATLRMLSHRHLSHSGEEQDTWVVCRHLALSFSLLLFPCMSFFSSSVVHFVLPLPRTLLCCCFILSSPAAALSKRVGPTRKLHNSNPDKNHKHFLVALLYSLPLLHILSSDSLFQSQLFPLSMPLRDT